MNAVLQRLTALEKANRVRIARAEMKRELGELPAVESVARAADLIESECDLVMGTKLSELMLSCSRFGAITLGSLCRHVGLTSADRRISSLTDRQRREIVMALRSPSVMPRRYSR
jgi:hypothetical protein